MRLAAVDNAWKEVFLQKGGILDNYFQDIKESLPENVDRNAWAESIPFVSDLAAEELEYILRIQKEYQNYSEEIKKEIVRVRAEQAKSFLDTFFLTVEKTGDITWEEIYLEDYKDCRNKQETQDFLKACKLVKQGSWIVEDDCFLVSGCDLRVCKPFPKDAIPRLIEIYRNILAEILLDKEINEKAPEKLPELPNLKKLTEGTNPVLREWMGGKYKCASLERFIKEYQRLSEDISPALIRDYLVNNRTGLQYTKNTIEQNLKNFRVT